MAVDVGETIVAALEAMGEFLVVEAQEVHPGGLEVVDVHGVLCDGESKLVGLAVAETAFHASASHDHGEGIWVVIPSEDLALSSTSLAEGGAAELAADDNQGVIKHTALLEVLDQGGDGFVHGGALVSEAVADACTGAGAVEVPAPVKELNKAHALLTEAAG